MKIIEFNEIDSTNVYAKEKAEEGVVENVVIWAHRQTAGRGRQGNTWNSPEGNLYMSVILKLEVDKKHIGQLSFLASVALANVLSNLLDRTHKINLKWPNDVLLNEKKLAGILVETEANADWAVIGIGVNVKLAPEGAVCLKDVGVDIEVKDLLDKLLEQIQLLKRQDFKDIREIWLKHAYKINEEIKARLPKETLHGIFRGIDEEGVLLLELKDGTIRKINSGEVFL